ELAERDPSWRPPGIGINVMPAAVSRSALGKGTDTEAHLLSSGPVGELEYTIILYKAGEPIGINLRAHPDCVDAARNLSAGVNEFIDDVLGDLDAPVWTAAPRGEHDTDGIGPLALPAAVAMRRDSAATSVSEYTAEFALPRGTQREHVVDAVRAVLEHHHGTRAKLSALAPILWTLEVPDAIDLDALAESIVAESDADGATKIDADAATKIDTDVSVGRVLAVEISDEPSELRVSGAKSVLDPRSWEIVVSDLRRALGAIVAGLAPQLPTVPVSLKSHARVFAAAAAAPERLAEISTWMEIAAPGAELVSGGAAATPDEVTIALPVGADDAAALVGGTAADVWAAVTALAVSRFSARQADSLLIDVWRDGRTGGLDRTVGPIGWTTPVRLELSGGGAANADGGGAANTDGAALEALRSAKEAARRVPDDGIGWPMLRYSNVQAGPALAPLSAPQVLVRVDGEALRDYALDVAINTSAAGAVLRTDGRLDHAQLGELAALWEQAAVEIISLSGGAGLTPSDVQHISLTQAEIDSVQAATDAVVEDIWPLSPLQRGLYFQSTFDSEGTDIYTAQFSLDFGHRIDVARMRGAAAKLLDANPTVRAGFVGNGVADPVQFIARGSSSGLEVPFTEVDLTDLAPQAQQARAQELMEADRHEPFDLTAPPLWRMLLIHLDGIDRLVVNREFIVWDGWSGALVVDQLLAFYADDDPQLSNAQFTDYLAWLAQRDPQAAAQAWREAFDGFDEPTLLAGPIRERTAQVPERIESYVSEELTTALRASARRAGVTLNALMNAVMGLLLSAESGRSDIVFGSTVAGRPTEIDGLDRVVGMFLNTVPIRVTLNPGETLTELLRRMQDDYVERMEHEYLGLGEIQQALGRTELFDTLFVLQNFKDNATIEAQSKRYGIVSEDSLDHTHYPLAVVVSPSQTLHIKIDYRPDLIPVQRARALHERFRALLELFAADSDGLVGSVDALTPTELAATRVQWQTPLPDVDDITVAEMLLAQANQTPDVTALVFDEVRYSYRELADAVETLASELLARGAGPEVVIALGLPRSIDMVVALFAVLRTGSAYLPLELDQPDGRLTTIIEDAQPSLFVTADTVRGRLDLPADQCVYVGQANPDAAVRDSDLGAFAPGTPGRLRHPAYVIYTSGSTGKPKGVITPYLGLTNMQRNHQAAIFDPVVAAASGPNGDTARLRVAHTVSFAFDMSWEELLWLVEGHEVHVCDEELRRDSLALVEYCDAHAIDVVNVTPTYATQLFADGLLDDSGERHRPPLVLLGGEAVPDSVWNRLRDTDGTLGYNLYGPTEYTINTLGAGTDDSETPTVGVPIRATRAHILDSFLRPVPDGVPGELYIAGVGLARGYLGRFDLTAERFIADPFAEPGARMYRTGDLVRRRPAYASGDDSGVWDDNIDYLGRTDDQVKIRGYRVELHEIDSVLESHELVATAAVIAVADPLVPGTKRLAAYVVPASGDAASFDSAPVLKHLRELLPDYMVPSHVQAVDVLPMTVNGKLDVKALPEPTLRPAVGSREPATREERILCEIFAELLGIDTVGAEDDFFELGGHSMIAMRMVSKVRSEFDVQLSIRDLFEARTVAAIAKRLPSAQQAKPAIVAGPRPERVPLSAAQERLWMLQQLQRDSVPYHYAHAAILRGDLDVTALQAAFVDVVTRHETLRTLIGVDTANNDDAYQLILDPRSAAEQLQFTVLDVSADADPQASARTIAFEKLTANFNLREDLPIRLTVIKVGEQQHLIAIAMHHIATDEWSDAPLLGDLTRAYLGRVSGTAPQWQELPVQYADYTLWQQQILDSGASESELEFWTQTLEGLAEEMPLPTDRSRPAHPTGNAGTVRATVDPHVGNALRTIADAHGASPFMVLHAATAAALSRFGAGEDIVVGSPASGRSDSALDDLVGFFVNTVVLRTDVSGNPTFGELVERVRDADLKAMEHQELPFQLLVEKLAPARVDGRNPLFQVMLSYLQRPAVLPDFLGIPTEWEPLSNVRAKFDLTITYVDAPDTGEISINVEYATDLFDEATAQSLADALVQLLGACGAGEQARIDELTVLSDAAASAALALGDGGPAIANTAPQQSISASTVGEALRAAAQRTPEATALVGATLSGERVELSYRELAARTAQIARYLAAQGTRSGDIVAIAVPRSIDQIVAIHAAVQLGAAYLPIDTTLPQSRIEYLLTDAKPASVLTATGVELPDTASSVIVLDDPETAAAITSSDTAAITDAERGGAVTTAHPLYVIYTSGSTGNPKGVVVAHRSVTNRLDWVQADDAITDADRIIVKTPASFDVSVWELFWPFLHGATAIVAGPQAHRDPAEVGALIRDHAVTIAHFVPSMLDEALATPENLTSLRRIVASGEALGASTARRVAQRLPQVRLDNLYGPTEAAVEVTLAADVSHSDSAPTIGRVGEGVQMYVLDARLRPVPQGVSGDLYIGGIQVADGYLGRSALTSERFVADPFGDAASRLYRTGDVARWNARGELDFLGRADDQVKIRGMRIELGEVTGYLEAAPGVSRAAVSVHNAETGPILVGYVVAAADATAFDTAAVRSAFDTAAVRSALIGAIPDHLVPSVIMEINEIPVSPNGKLDRRRLPTPDTSARAQREPSTETEARLCALFAGVLADSEDGNSVGPDDSFFALGGHSLSAIRLVNAIKREWGVDLGVRDIFESPTPAALAIVLGTRAIGTALPPLTRYERPESGEGIPVSAAQRRMWLVEQLGAAASADAAVSADTAVAGGAGVYNVPISWRVAGGVDADAFAAAIGDLLARHEALRTIYPAGPDGEPVQVIVPTDQVRVDVSTQTIAEADLTAALREATRHRFDLQFEVPVRVSLFSVEGDTERDASNDTERDASNDTVVALVIHHIAVDEWSTSALLTDLATAYGLRQVGQSPAWEPLDVQYADYALWQREILGDAGAPSELATGQLDYWKSALADLPDVIELPTDRSRPARFTYRGGAVPLGVDAPTLRGLRALAADHGVSMFMLMHAAVAALLSKSGAGEDIPLGTPVSGRRDASLEPLVGFFLNTLVLRADLSGDPTVAQLLDRVRATDFAAFENQDVPFDQVVDAVSGRRAGVRSVHPLFQTMIVYLTQPDPTQLLGGGITPQPIEPDTSKFDLSFDFVEYTGLAGADAGESADVVVGVIEYSSDLFDRETVQRLADGLTVLLGQLANAAPTERLSQLSAIPVQDRQLIDTASSRPGISGAANTAVDLFDHAAEQYPDRVAVVDGEREWSFTELASRVRRLARHLVAQGVGPEVPVALLLPRTTHALSAIFGVMTAGGAYVAIDPATPTARIETILETAQPTVVLTTESTASALPGTYRGHVVVLDDPTFDDALAAYSDAPLTDTDRKAPLLAEHPAYVVFTSGSTGTPKAVEAVHRGLVALWHSHRADLYQPTTAQAGRDHLHVGHAWSFAFDASWQPQLWLLDGHTLYLVNEDTRRDPVQMVAQAHRQRWDFLEVTPSHLTQLLDAGLVGDEGPTTLGFGGEAVAGPLWDRLNGLAATRGTLAFNLYGPSESTVDALVARTSQSAQPVAGGPVAGTAARILDRWLQPVPVGVTGELYLSGEGLARGYRGESALTATRFVADSDGTRMYRTGDRARWLPDGTIAYRGRGDDQVKIRGHRVEPAEIEATLLARADIQDAVVIARTDLGAPTALCAYVVPADQGTFSLDALRSDLRTLLPDYMVPATITVLAAIPTSANGKVDRRALPRPELDLTAYREPSTPAEQVLCDAIAQVLGVDQVGADDDVFSLGLDSIGVMALLRKVREAGFDTTAAAVFAAQSIAELATHMESSSQTFESTTRGS
ncbi:MAG: amino acid adenylation domain-containing protein, partial [Rhodococcus sp.]|nr:amino acid adenylation domain-containing protein [Rhodococcus sp. (in: high G+C Gram-positive bacteria)]